MPQPPRHPNVVNERDIPERPIEKGQFRLRARRLGAPAGSQMLGATLYELAPRSLAMPFHYHCATEEAIYVLRGKGIARLGDQRVAVGPGDFIAMPTGPDHAHQMINESDEPLVYLCMSANPVKADVVGYPDSKKVAGFAGAFEKPLHRWISKEGESVDYFLDEPSAK